MGEHARQMPQMQAEVMAKEDIYSFCPCRHCRKRRDLAAYKLARVSAPPPPLRWTTERPQAEGWYWIEHADAKQIDYYSRWDSLLCGLDVELVLRWAGPIPLPEETP